jgi:hypothetical protein
VWAYKSVGGFTLLAALFLVLVSGIGNNNVTYGDKKMECGDLQWNDKGHDDNNPSSKKFKNAAYEKSLCELAKGIDHEVYHNHVSVDWDKFQKSPAFINAEEEQQDCLTKAHKDGNGMDGLGGYEILYCAVDED